MDAIRNHTLTEKDIIHALKERQADMTNRAFAEILGVHESYLSKVYAGQIPVGAILVRGLARAFPELQEGLALFLLGDLHIGKAS